MPLVNPKKKALALPDIHASLANKVLKVLLYGDKDNILPSAPQNLKTLALGAFTYRDVRNGLGFGSVPNRDLYEFLRPSIYRVTSSYDYVEGRRKPLAVLTETGTYEKTEANGGGVNILKPYWLG